MHGVATGGGVTDIKVSPSGHTLAYGVMGDHYGDTVVVIAADPGLNITGVYHNDMLLGCVDIAVTDTSIWLGSFMYTLVIDSISLTTIDTVRVGSSLRGMKYWSGVINDSGAGDVGEPMALVGCITIGDIRLYNVDDRSRIESFSLGTLNGRLADISFTKESSMRSTDSGLVYCAYKDFAEYRSMNGDILSTVQSLEDEEWNCLATASSSHASSGKETVYLGGDAGISEWVPESGAVARNIDCGVVRNLAYEAGTLAAATDDGVYIKRGGSDISLDLPGAYHVALAPDGLTAYVSSFETEAIYAVDLSGL
jgi:hypothetical protein